MKLKILKTILCYLGIIIISYSIYLEKGIPNALAVFGTMLIASIMYLWMEYDDFDKRN